MPPPLPPDLANAPAAGEALLRQADGTWLLLRDPMESRVAWQLQEVLPLLEWVEHAVETASIFAAGYLAYEAAPAFDPALTCHAPEPGLPLAAWCLYREAIPFDALPPAPAYASKAVDSPSDSPTERLGAETGIGNGWPNYWDPDLTYPEYREKLTKLHDHLHSGNSYQANFCFGLEYSARYGGAMDRQKLWEFFLRHAPTAPAAAWLESAHRVIASASPELFLERLGTRVQTRPMKGTRPRGASPREDRRLANDLASHPKDRAENLMIVDMVRNDLGRVAAPGSVRAEQLFQLERYPTVWQMTSTVTAKLPPRTPTCAVLQALFPCASITGAPKVRTSQLLRGLEAGPRGIYTGSIGQLLPGQRARFNVAIRTLILDRTTGAARYGTGSGILHDSIPVEEWAECQTKSRLLDGFASFGPSASRSGSSALASGGEWLLETLRIRDGQILLLDEHLERLCGSALLRGWPAPLGALRQAVSHARATPLPDARLRLLLDPQGTCSCELIPEQGPAPRLYPPPTTELDRQLSWWATLPTLRAILCQTRVDSRDPQLYCKSTARARYQAAQKQAQELGADEALLLNERGELTEGCNANLALLTEGGWVTPRLGCGLLEGTLRRHLLRRGDIPLRTGVLLPEQLGRVHALALFNSVRGWRRVELQA